MQGNQPAVKRKLTDATVAANGRRRLKLRRMTSKDAANAGKRVRPSPPQQITSCPVPTSIVWYRDFDLRLHDHAPLALASQLGSVIPVFIWPSKRGPLDLGGAAQVPMVGHASAPLLHVTCALRLGSKSRSRACIRAWLTWAAASSCGEERVS